METFIEIVNFPDYLVSNYGRVKTKSRKVRYLHSVTKEERFRVTEERILKEYSNNRTGYKFYQLYKNKKSYNKTTHSLVASCFIPNTDNLNQINHKDGNKHNNHVDNLEWCTNIYNHEHATKTGLKAKGVNVASSKLNENMVNAIKYFLNKGFTHNELAIAFGVSRPAISMISQNKTWKHILLTNEELTITQ